jgi:hypothetical protein
MSRHLNIVPDPEPEQGGLEHDREHDRVFNERTLHALVTVWLLFMCSAVSLWLFHMVVASLLAG